MYELNFVWRHSTPVTPSFNRCFNPEASWFCSPVVQHGRLYAVDLSGETFRLAISLRLAVDFVTYIKDKCRYLVFYLTYYGQVGFLNKFRTFLGVPWGQIHWEAWAFDVGGSTSEGIRLWTVYSVLRCIVRAVTRYRLTAVARNWFLSFALHSRITVTDVPVPQQRRAVKAVLTQRAAAEAG
jgi:hypothetical protein